MIYDPSSLSQLSASPACFSGGLCRVPRAAAELPELSCSSPPQPCPYLFVTQRAAAHQSCGPSAVNTVLGLCWMKSCLGLVPSRHEERHPRGTSRFVQLGKGSPRKLWPSRFSPRGSVSTCEAGRVTPGHPAGTLKVQPSNALGKLLSSMVGWPTNNLCAQGRGGLFWKIRAKQRGAAAHSKDVHTC